MYCSRSLRGWDIYRPHLRLSWIEFLGYKGRSNHRTSWPLCIHRIEITFSHRTKEHLASLHERRRGISRFVTEGMASVLLSRGCGWNIYYATREEGKSLGFLANVDCSKGATVENITEVLFNHESKKGNQIRIQGYNMPVICNTDHSLCSVHLFLGIWMHI